MIQFKCPGCGKAFRVDDSLAGKHAKCNACGQRFVVPEAVSLLPVARLVEMPSRYPTPLPVPQFSPAVNASVGAAPRPQSYSGSQLTTIGNTEAVCPYCGGRLDKKPGRKTECPKCSRPIYVRTRPLDKQQVLVTEEQKEVIEEQWSIVNGSHEVYLADRNARDLAANITSQLADCSAEPALGCQAEAQKSESITNNSLRRVVLMEPGQFTPYIAAHFDEVAEDQIAAAEAELTKAYLQSPEVARLSAVSWRSAAGRRYLKIPEVALLYAFRVSKCVPRVTRFETLASRWSVACFGPRGVVGLFAGQDSVNYHRAYEFLAALFLTRFRELARAVAEKAEGSAAKRKSVAAKENIYYTAISKIEDAGKLLDHRTYVSAEGLLWKEEAKRWIDYLKQKAAAISGGPK